MKRIVPLFLLLALLGQGTAPVDAAAAAAWLHGKAGDCCAELTGEIGMTPGDMIRTIPNVLKNLS